ncbi:hypothetical protein [Mycobacteroides abscessus]|uniref:hypothetical protein n=1 Tax=Mycobacteroides abscessus TaxID=36809 RepID=UPI00092C3A97|nr:hypothetical protein [Mycobacteroides abscessus]MBN7371081.1 hypothetical protein [Mycobacteroides abscessus subsp. abscessus]MBN7522535.1 hypothetical protein [Mycobacteroides abscessus subsp. abscessus]MDB2185183.1 hypothetical protein [Mycobacteroides abscessus subsp. abscessus]MDO3123464.1 hypothetical protein [Mycobacteroides abscessus subsp. abscessus]MDO3173275.1 hypothetical protein [Mycobacteroides abscessus subsp. abscessus]
MPTARSRDRRAADLRERAALVRRDGWSPYASTWSSGEVLGVRAVLGEPGAIDAAVETWAPTLWGAGAADADARTGYQSTRRWFATVMSLDAEESIDLTRPSGWPPIDPDDGWAKLLTELRADLERIDPELVVRQVKQKGGQLCVWAEASDPTLADAVHDRIAAAEEQSAVTCERCGRPGSIRQRSDGWYQALCAKHAEAASETEGQP